MCLQKCFACSSTRFLCALSHRPGSVPFDPINEFGTLAATRYRRAIKRNELNRVSIAAVIFLVAFTLLTYAAVKFRRRVGDVGREPAQVYGSIQIEVAWTVIPDRQGVDGFT